LWRRPRLKLGCGAKERRKKERKKESQKEGKLCVVNYLIGCLVLSAT
jgi:hypothetical protein